MKHHHEYNDSDIHDDIELNLPQTQLTGRQSHDDEGGHDDNESAMYVGLLKILQGIVTDLDDEFENVAVLVALVDGILDDEVRDECVEVDIMGIVSDEVCNADDDEFEYDAIILQVILMLPTIDDDEVEVRAEVAMKTGIVEEADVNEWLF